MSRPTPPLSRLRPILAELKAYTVPAAPPPVKLDANESPWPLAETVRRSIADAVASLPFHRYPDGRATGLRRALARHLDADGDELILGAGSDEVIAILLQAFMTPHEGRAPVVLFPGPSFVMYRISALTHGYEPVEVPLDADFALDPAAMHAAFRDHAPALAFYATPNNPTGNPYDEAVLRDLVASYPDTLHIIDEAYGPFARQRPEDRAHTLSPWLAEHGNVAVMSTLSKIGLAALRLGWLRAHPALVHELEKARQPFNLSATAQIAAQVVLEQHGDAVEEAIRAVVAEREVLSAGLAERGLDPRPSQANFVLARLPASRKEPLLAQGVALRFFSDPRLDGWARVTVGTPAETRALFAALDATG
ncbi:MAG: histidinol-phosphate transaminase [Sandaracinus sp.]|nr:histidinol-phosphate transaminase [Sandaracinus sp.]|tara:strand:+ start:179 stop:1273 length:1095 start_codon:yes stop_codon:yes gene_type:complete